MNATKQLTGILIVSLGFLAQAIRAGEPANTVRYDAQPAGSKVKMEGTSTIHDWTVESPIIGGFMEVDSKFPESALTNAQVARPNVLVTIPIRTLKSYAKKMDEVMQEHLNMAKFPKIEYRLVELKPRSAPGAAGALQFDAVGTLTVSGVTRTNTMSVTFERVDGGKLKVTGSTPLKMTDFGVQPPAPSILGMPVISTGDDIKISFEWITATKAQ